MRNRVTFGTELTEVMSVCLFNLNHDVFLNLTDLSKPKKTVTLTQRSSTPVTGSTQLSCCFWSDCQLTYSSGSQSGGGGARADPLQGRRGTATGLNE